MTYCWAVGLVSGLAFIALVLAGFAAVIGTIIGIGAAGSYAEKHVHPPRWLLLVGHSLAVLCFIPIAGVVLILLPHEIGCLVRTQGFWHVFLGMFGK